MTIETINGIRVITPNVGYWLYKADEKIISDKVFLGVNASENDWVEITEEEKENLEILWKAFEEN